MQFLQYAQSLNPVVLQIPLAGHVTPYDSYARTVSLGANIYFNKTSRQGSAIKINGSAYSVAHGVEQLFTNLTLFCYYPNTLIDNGGSQYLASKWEQAGDPDWLLRMLPGGTVRFYDILTSYVTTTASFNGYKSLVVRVTSGVDIDFFADGAFVEQEASLSFATQPGHNIYIGSLKTGTTVCEAPIGIFGLFTSALTDTQIANLHTLAERMIVGHEPKTFYSKPVESVITPLIDIYVEPGIIPNRGSATADGHVSGELSFISKNGLITCRSYGDTNSEGVIGLGNDSSIANKNSISIVIDDLVIYGTGAGGSGRVFDKGKFYCYPIATGELRLRCSYSDGSAAWDISNYELNYPGQLVITWNKSNPAALPVAYLNGAELTVVNITPKSGAIDDDSANELNLTNNAFTGGVRSGDCEFSRFRMYDSILTSDQISVEYQKFAIKHIVRPTPRFEYPITTSAVTAPGHCGPWLTHAGSHEWLDDGNQRYLNFGATGNNFASIQSDQAYGAWYAEFKNEGTSGVDLFAFISSEPNIIYAGSGQQGYAFYRQNVNGDLALFRMNGGSATYLGGVASRGTANELYKIFITRRLSDGLFKVYLKDQAHYNFTLAFQCTDNTYTTSKFIQVYNTAVQSLKVYNNIKFFPYGDSLTPDDIPGLED